MDEDLQLLRRYAEENSEEAFGQLVRRHLPLVYSTALRLVARDSHLAQDITQTVFTDVARKAAFLKSGVVLPGWLYRHTCFTASKAVRTERRRKLRESQAAAMSALEEYPDRSGIWPQIAPVLDEAMNRLGEKDRAAIVLRYFENRDLRSIGKALGTSEDTAQKRVSRALERLRKALAKHGAVSTAAALAGALACASAEAVPAGLGATITAGAIAGAGASSVGLTLAIVKLMNLPNLKLGLAVVAVAAGAATPIVMQHQSIARLRTENTSLRAQTGELDKLRQESQKLASAQIDPAELERLRTGTTELPRLRGEVTRLKHELDAMAQLKSEYAQLRSAWSNQVAQTHAAQTEIQHVQTAEDSKREAYARMNMLKQWLLAYVMYANDNNGQLPGKFDDVNGTYIKKGSFDPNPAAGTDLSTDQFEQLFAGKIEDIKNPAEAILIREKEAHLYPDGNYAKAYGFADGHVEIHKEPGGDYNEWEKQHALITSAK